MSRPNGPVDALRVPHAGALFLKREDEFEWPEDLRMFHVLAAQGLFRCRNHEFFRSCVPAPTGPAGLGDLESFLECSFPVIPRELFERIVGFFDRIRRLHNSEASVLLAYDREAEEVRLVVPEQTATVTRYSDGYQHPIGLHYFPPIDLPPSWIVFGDVHSHVDLAAYSSATDVDDESHGAGLHVVVGRLYREPPDVHVEAVVDGERFELRLDDVVEGYGARSRDVPEEWVRRVRVEALGSWSAAGANGSAADDEERP